jgi:hypothetical protein
MRLKLALVAAFCLAFPLSASANLRTENICQLVLHPPAIKQHAHICEPKSSVNQVLHLHSRCAYAKYDAEGRLSGTSRFHT